MNSEHEMVPPAHEMPWNRCARPGRVLLPPVDREPWRLVERLAAVAAQAVAVDASVTAAELDALPHPGNSG
ncbi:hypothetical protein [Streptomyces phaeoluteigriseus]|uniref:hypothetical protein n=1 Tax=Streptomyces phaeoluteigriseus TaxID=114686 RepID=UPI0036C3C3C8